MCWPLRATPNSSAGSVATVKRFAIVLLLAGLLGLWPAPSRADDCARTGVIDAYQPQVGEVADAMDQAAANQLRFDRYTTIPDLGKGWPEPTPVPGTVPPTLLKAIGLVESSWYQAAYSVPRGSFGPPLTPSGGCGYGVMQITSGMTRPGELPVDVQQRIAREYAYNIARGATMLGYKWVVTPAVGTNDPAVPEHWYFAVWAYNSWSYLNNPNNPAYPWPRPPFDGTQPRKNYPYQELVFGYANNPPYGRWPKPFPALVLPPREWVGATTPDNAPAWIPDPRSIAVSSYRVVLFAESGGAPARAIIAITDPSGGSVGWRVTGKVGDWLSYSPGTGTTPGQLTLTGNPVGLANGVYTGRVDLVGDNRPDITISVTIELRVGPFYRTFMPLVGRGRP